MVNWWLERATWNCLPGANQNKLFERPEYKYYLRLTQYLANCMKDPEKISATRKAGLFWVFLQPRYKLNQ